jgi:hypothetical protein
MNKTVFTPLRLSVFMALVAALPQAQAADTSLNNLFNLKQSCPSGSASVSTIGQMLGCGTVHGAIKTAYYSLDNAYFGSSSQDTAVIGGYIKYETAAYLGLQLGVGFDLQRRLDDEKGNAEVSELQEDRDGLAEAYITWKNDFARVTVGNQRLNLPFLGDYSEWRVLQFLYQAADVQIGNQTDYIRLTKVNKYKSYGEDEFTETSRQNSTLETDGMWSIGGAKSYQLNPELLLKGQAWYQRYEDYSDLIYAEGSLSFSKHPLSPSVALQVMSGQDQGQAYAGKVDSQVYGTQVTLQPKGINLKLGYDYIKPKKDAYLNGALLTPYSRNTSSGLFFAQPYFTSTQDLGAGNAYMVAIDGKLNPQTILGARYSFMDLKESATVKSRNQSEYLLYGIYNFSGKLKGFSLSDFVGVQTSPRSDKNFWQNRLTLTYRF